VDISSPRTKGGVKRRTNMVTERYRPYITADVCTLWILAVPLPDRLLQGQLLHVTLVKKLAGPGEGETETYYPMYRPGGYLGELWYQFHDAAAKPVECGDEAGALAFLAHLPEAEAGDITGE
jgi:hypothetical protein